ncbi:MAG: hypothetical protein EXS18_05285 [Verrucomicrobiae bacterium]|nr:hypothetical protein [Verrucomicrobiae bacterium]
MNDKVAQQKPHTGLQAGVGRAEITCAEGELAYGLYPEKTMAHIPPQYRDMKVTIDDPLFVRALVLDDSGEKLVLVTLDVCAIGARSISQFILNDSADDFVPRVRKRVEQELGIPGDRVSLSASHTHPPGRLLCDDEEQIKRTVAAIKQALNNLTPVTIGVGAGHEDTLTINRTMVMKNGTDYTWRPEPSGKEIEKLRPIDPEIGIVRIDRLDGSPLAVLYDFASHLLVGCRKGAVTADFPGVTSRYLEETLGGGVMAIFLQGANGDIVEASYDNYETPHTKSKDDFGYQLGRSVLMAYRTITTGPAPIKVATRNVEFPLRKDIPEAVAAAKREQMELMRSVRYTDLSFKTFLPLYLKYSLHPDPNHVPQRYMAADNSGDGSFRTLDEHNRGAVKKYLESLRAMELMSISELKIGTLEKHQELITELGGVSVPAEIKGIRIGECVFIAAPMEMLAEVGFNVKKWSPFKHTYVISDANGYLHYALPASYYGRGGYEATECLLAPDWEKIFEQAVRQILEEL